MKKQQMSKEEKKQNKEHKLIEKFVNKRDKLKQKYMTKKVLKKKFNINSLEEFLEEES